MRGIDVVGIGSRTTGVVLGEAENIKVVYDANNRVCLTEVVELGRWKARFNQLAGYTEGMVGIVVKIATNKVEDRLGNIGGLVKHIGFVQDEGA